MDLTTPLGAIKGIGPSRAAMLEAKGLFTVEDLLATSRSATKTAATPRTITAARAGRDGDRNRGGVRSSKLSRA